MHLRHGADGFEGVSGVQELSGYPVMPTRVAGIEMIWPAALINEYEQSNVTISGKGTVDCDGKVWWDKYWKMREAGVTFGSETSGGIRDVEVYRVHVLPGVPNGILFKSASTRGGTIQDIDIHDMDVI